MSLLYVASWCVQVALQGKVPEDPIKEKGLQIKVCMVLAMHHSVFIVVLIHVLSAALGLIVPPNLIQSCATSVGFCNIDFVAGETSPPILQIYTLGYGGCRESNDCVALKGPECKEPSGESLLVCSFGPTNVLRLLPYSGNNIGPDRNQCPSLVRVQKVAQGSKAPDSNECAVGTMLYLPTVYMSGLPGYFFRGGASKTSPTYLVQANNICPACASPSRCNDGANGVGCCEARGERGVSACTCPSGTTGPTCSKPCDTGKARCNNDGNCNPQGQRIDATNALVPWGTTECTCQLAYFGDDCTQTCAPSCTSHGQCVRGPHSPTPFCLCDVSWSGETCSESLVDCSGETPLTPDEPLCSGRGLCVGTATVTATA